jgi:imidazoleglycerol-phosphate dehydratase
MTPPRQEERLHVRARPAAAEPRANVDTGLPVLDHLIGVLARYAWLDVSLAVAPGEGRAGIAAAVRALGAELSRELRRPGARGYGAAAMPAAEALAHVALEAVDAPRLVSNVDLSEARLGGLASDVVAEALQAFATGAGLNLHVRLIAGDDAQHVLEAMFKALGVAVADACTGRG